MFDVTSKLEINMDDPTVPIPVITEMAVKYRAAAVVVYDPAYITPMIQSRISTNGRFKIILAVDFAKGDQYAMAKFRDYGPDVDITQADGFDIRLTTSKAHNEPLNEVEVFNEVKVLRDFLYGIKNIYDIRFTIDIFSRGFEQVEYALKSLKKVPCTMIRLDHHVNMHGSKANETTTLQSIDIIRRYTGTPIKVSTNVDRAMFDALKGKAARFDVTATALSQIAHSLEETPAIPDSHTIIEREGRAPVKTAELPDPKDLNPDKDLVKTTKPAPEAEREMVQQPVKATKGVITDKKEPHHMKVQKSLEVNTKVFTDTPTTAKKQGGNTVTPPPRNAKRQ